MINFIYIFYIVGGGMNTFRSFNILYGKGEAANNDPVFVFEAEGDDNWLPWVVNYYGGTDFPTDSPTQAGKNMGYTDWTHA